MARTIPPVRASTARGVLAGLVAFAIPTVGFAEDGDALDPAGFRVESGRDPRGMTLLQPERRRTPTGILYPYPPEAPRYRSLGDTWLARGALAATVLFDAGDEGEARFERFAEWTDEGFLRGLALEVLNEERGHWLELSLGNVGRRDQYARIEVGRAGFWRARAAMSRIPHLFANDARVLYAGTGTPGLTLPAPLAPGANPSAALDAALSGVGERTLELRRDRSELALDWRVTPALRLSAAYGFEDREGERPSGSAFSFPMITAGQGGTSETAQPVDDRTHDVTAALAWAGDAAAFNLGYSGSFYRNRDKFLVFENPFDTTATGLVERARFSGDPDNDAHALRGDVALELPFGARVTTSVVGQLAKQDDDLLAPTVNATTVGGVDLSQWNSASALSQSSADVEVRSFRSDTVLELRPLDPLRVKAELHIDAWDRDLSYVAFNPATGQFGYIVEDGGQASVLGGAFSGVSQIPGPGADFPYRSPALGARTRRWGASALYRLPMRSSAELGFERRAERRDDREVRSVRENRFRVSVGSQGLPRSSVRASYVYSARHASAVDVAVNADTLFSSLPGFAPLLPTALGLRQLQRPDVADRGRHQGNLRVNLLLTDALDGSVAASWTADDYRTPFGLKSARRTAVDVETRWQPSPKLGVYAFGGFERSSRSQGSIRAAIGSTDPDAGGAAYPFANRWSADLRERTLTGGAGIEAGPWNRLTLALDYTLQDAISSTHYVFAPGALVGPPVTAGSRLPDLTRRDHDLRAKLRWDVRSHLSFSFEGRWLRSDLTDWAQTLLVPRVGNRIFFGHVDRDFRAALYTITVEARF